MVIPCYKDWGEVEVTSLNRCGVVTAWRALRRDRNQVPTSPREQRKWAEQLRRRVRKQLRDAISLWLWTGRLASLSLVSSPTGKPPVGEAAARRRAMMVSYVRDSGPGPRRGLPEGAITCQASLWAGQGFEVGCPAWSWPAGHSGQAVGPAWRSLPCVHAPPRGPPKGCLSLLSPSCWILRLGLLEP